MIFNRSIIAKPKFQFSEELSQGICWLKWFNFDVVQSMPQRFIYQKWCLLAKLGSLMSVVCSPNLMPSIPLFWVLAMLVVQSSCFAICFPPSIFQSNYLPMSLYLCWIRGTCNIRLLGVNSFFLGSIIRWWWWCTRYIVHWYIIGQLAHEWRFRCTDWNRRMMAQVNPIMPVVESCQVLAHHTSRYGWYCAWWVSSQSWSKNILSRSRTWHVSGGCSIYSRNGQWTSIWINLDHASGCDLVPHGYLLKAN